MTSVAIPTPKWRSSHSEILANIATDASVKSASSDWRGSLSQRARQKRISGVESVHHSKATDAYNAKAAQTHNLLPVLALGHSTRTKELISFIKTPLSKDKKAETYGKLPISGSLSAIDWKGNSLVCGTQEGSVYYYQCNPSTPFDEDAIQDSVVEFRSKAPQSYLLPVALPHINAVAVNEREPSIFVSLQGNAVHIWNIEQPETPTVTKKITALPQTALDWSPYSINQFMIGGMSRSLHLIDLRLFENATSSTEIDSVRPSVWKAKNAHNGGITSIQFHPFVPYWFASAGEDATIQLWDIRFGSQPVLSLQEHSHTISKVSWSHSHAEILVSSSLDHTVKLWSCNAGPHYVLTTVEEDFSSSVLSADFIRNPRSKVTDSDYMSFNAVSSSGEVVTTFVSASFLMPLVQSKFHQQETDEANVETDIYFRDFSSGFSKSVELAQKYQSISRPEKALTILELCYERRPMDLEEAMRTSAASLLRREGDSASSIFARDMLSYAYFIPPNFPADMASQPKSNVLEQVQNLKLSIEILKFVGDDDINQLLEREQDIYDALTGNIKTLSPVLLSDYLEVVLSYDYLKGVKIALKLADIYLLAGNWKDYIIIARLLLHPTIFDNSAPKESPKNTPAKPTPLKSYSFPVLPANSNLFMKSDTCLEQIHFIKKFFKLLLSANPGDQEMLVELYQSHKPKSSDVIWSATVNRIYFNLLLHLNRFDEFYIGINQLMKKVDGVSDFYDILFRLEREGDSQLQDYLQSVHHIVVNVVKDRKGPIKAYKEALLRVVILLQKCPNLPANVMEILPSSIAQLLYDLESCLASIAKMKSDARGVTGKDKASRIAQKILDELGLYVTNVENVPRSWKRQYSDLINMLKEVVEQTN